MTDHVYFTDQLKTVRIEFSTRISQDQMDEYSSPVIGKVYLDDVWVSDYEGESQVEIISQIHNLAWGKPFVWSERPGQLEVDAEVRFDDDYSGVDVEILTLKDEKSYGNPALKMYTNSFMKSGSTEISFRLFLPQIASEEAEDEFKAMLKQHPWITEAMSQAVASAYLRHLGKIPVIPKPINLETIMAMDVH